MVFTIEPIIILILVWGIPFTVLGMLYLLAKKYPRISRELHSNDCKCKVCYPLQSLDKGVKK